MPRENTKFPEPLSINRPTKGAKIAATIRDKVYAPVSEVVEKPNWVSHIGRKAGNEEKHGAQASVWEIAKGNTYTVNRIPEIPEPSSFAFCIKSYQTI